MATNQPPPKQSSSGGGFDLTRKVGPLPIWGYLVAIVAGYVLYKHFTKSSSSTASTAATAGNTAANTGTETVTLPNGASYTGPVGGAPQSFNGSGGSTPLQTTSTPATPGATGSATPGSGGTSPYLSTPLGSQQSAAAQQAFLGTTEYNGNPYNIYNVSELGGPSGAYGALYPGQNPSQVGALDYGTGQATVAVPVYGGEGSPPPASAIPTVPAAA